MSAKLVKNPNETTILSSDIDESVLAVIQDPDVPQYYGHIVVRIGNEIVSLCDLDDRWDASDNLVLAPLAKGAEVLLTVE